MRQIHLIEFSCYFSLLHCLKHRLQSTLRLAVNSNFHFHGLQKDYSMTSTSNDCQKPFIVTIVAYTCPRRVLMMSRRLAF